MTRFTAFKQQLAGAIVLSLLFLAPDQAKALKYMDLKAAIKYFLPEGSAVSKVDKTIPADKMEGIMKCDKGDEKKAE